MDYLLRMKSASVGKLSHVANRNLYLLEYKVNKRCPGLSNPGIGLHKEKPNACLHAASSAYFYSSDIWSLF